MQQTHTFAGCSTVPLAHYLKALGLLRIVSRQLDSEANGWWERSDFRLRVDASREEVEHFLLHQYRPTPVINPWNGGSGFKLDKPKDAIVDARRAEAERFSVLSKAVDESFDLMEEFGFESKVTSAQKDEFLKACRSRMPEPMLDWIDAALVLTDERTLYPPLLGTGGNDGRLDFSKNFLQQIANLFDLDSGEPTVEAEGWLRSALYAEADSHLDDGAIGQFFPSATGGPNSTTGFGRDTKMNPWDFVLMLEGATMFASAAVRRLESSEPGAMSAPFTVYHVGVGHGSTDASEEDDARPETWIPIWSNPASYRELRALMAEGRVLVEGVDNDGNGFNRSARDGVDFARAIATLGVDRGIDAFQRFGFQQRNGRAYFATPLTRMEVSRRARAELVDELDGWLDLLGSRAADRHTPASVTAAVNRLQETIFDLCMRDDPSRVRRVLVQLGRVERIAAKRLGWANPSNGRSVPPLSGLSSAWIDAAYEESPEFRLAATLASTYGDFGKGDQTEYRAIRRNLEPVESYGPSAAGWRDNPGPEVVWQHGNPLDALNALVRRRITEARQADLAYWPDRARFPARLADIAQFLNGAVDLRRMIDFTWGLLGLDWSTVDPRDIERRNAADDVDRVHPAPGADYALIKLCYAGRPLRVGDAEKEIEVPIDSGIYQAAATGDGRRATERAAGRLRGAEIPPSVPRVATKGKRAHRIAAALVFPIDPRDLPRLLGRVTSTSKPAQRERPA